MNSVQNFIVRGWTVLFEIPVRCS